jgi:uncharacterized membrane protein
VPNSAHNNPSGPLTGPTSTGVDARLSALLCYLAWWVSGIVFLVVEQQHREVRFHAAQSLVLFGGVSVVLLLLAMLTLGMLFISPTAVDITYKLSTLVGLAALAVWLFLMLKILMGESFRVPFAGDLAARIAAR